MLLNLLLTLTTVAYPLAWLLDYPQVLVQLPLLMALLWGIKGGLQWQQQREKAYFSCLIALLLVIVYLTKSAQIMYWYPVLMNGFMLTLFAGSLFSSQSLVERMARLQTPNLTAKGVAYTRKVTQFWCVVFTFNIIITTAFIYWQQYQYWALYTGVIAYLIMALVMGGEWLIRQKVKQSHSE